MNTKHLIFTLSIISVVFLFSCNEDSESLEDSRIPRTIVFEPPSASWYSRGYPDSIIVKISGGIPPYSIKNRPEFSAEAKIEGENLILFPNFDVQDPPRTDFLVVQDNNLNIRAFNITVQSPVTYYDSIINFSIVVAGDTSFSVSKNDFVYLGGSWGQWDQFLGNIILGGETSSGYHSIKCTNVKDTGRFQYTDTFDVSLNSFNNIVKPFRLELIDIDNYIDVHLISTDELKIETDVVLIDRRNNFQGTHIAKINAHLLNTK